MLVFVFFFGFNGVTFQNGTPQHLWGPRLWMIAGRNRWLGEPPFSSHVGIRFASLESSFWSLSHWIRDTFSSYTQVNLPNIAGWKITIFFWIRRCIFKCLFFFPLSCLVFGDRWRLGRVFGGRARKASQMVTVSLGGVFFSESSRTSWTCGFDFKNL